MDTTAESATPTSPVTGPPGGRTKVVLLRAALFLPAALFVFAATPKLVGVHSAVTMFDDIGAGQWLRYFVGAAELAGAIGLLVPRLAGLAAAGLAADMAGASIINVTVLHSAAVALTVPLCVALIVIARTRWQPVSTLLARRARP
jgi:putative oxidoreductase